MSRKMNQHYDCHIACSVEVTLDIIGGKWKGVALYHLLKSTKRFNELRKLIPSVSPRMLTKQLRELEAHGLVKRTVYAVVPPKVEYALTDLGLTLEPVLLSLRTWGNISGRIAGRIAGRQALDSATPETGGPKAGSAGHKTRFV